MIINRITDIRYCGPSTDSKQKLLKVDTVYSLFVDRCKMTQHPSQGGAHHGSTASFAIFVPKGNLSLNALSTLTLRAGNATSRKLSQLDSHGLPPCGLQAAPRRSVTLPSKCLSSIITITMETSSGGQAPALPGVEDWRKTRTLRKTPCLSSTSRLRKSIESKTEAQRGRHYCQPMATTPSDDYDTFRSQFERPVCEELGVSRQDHSRSPLWESLPRDLTAPYEGTLHDSAPKLLSTPYELLPQVDGSHEKAPSPSHHYWPDRFIRDTPTKEAFLLANNSADGADPFASNGTRTIRMSQKYTTLRSVSHPTVWTVGGAAVTEGVASTSNGRGRRVTSGSSAPHYAAEFLRARSPTEDTLTHGRRLAVAMDINRAGPVVSPSSSPRSPPALDCGEGWQHVTWKNGRWERPAGKTPARLKSSAVKKMSTIPYKVLDAPALRDDFYCSLLAYSKTLQCLAVGLGIHVYL